MESKKGWWVVFGCFLALTLNAGIGFFVLPVVLESILEETGWTLTQVSFSVTLWGFSAAIISPFCGGIIDRFSAKWVMVFGTLFMSLTTYLFASVSSLWHLYLLMALAPIGSMANTYIPVATVISHWFSRHRGLATGLAMLGIGVGGSLIPQVAAYLLASDGWRATYSTMAVLSLFSLLPTLLWIKDPPKRSGENSEESKAGAESEEVGLSLAEAARTRTFWALSAGDALAGFVFSAFNLHLVYLLTQDLGTSEAATRVYSTFQICVAGGVLVFGPLADRFSLKPVLACCYLLPAVGTTLLIPGIGIPLAILAAIIAGLAGGGRSALFPVALTYGFGHRHLASIYGFSNTFFMIGTAVGPLAGGYLYDLHNNTSVIYASAATMLFVSGLLVSLIRDEKRRS